MLGFQGGLFSTNALDAFYNKGHVYMFVMDLNSERVYIVDLLMECQENKCTWLLYDLKDYDKLKDYTAIKSYCEKGDDAKKKPLDNCKTNITGNDLLEFDYLILPFLRQLTY